MVASSLSTTNFGNDIDNEQPVTDAKLYLNCWSDIDGIWGLESLFWTHSNVEIYQKGKTVSSIQFADQILMAFWG